MVVKNGDLPYRQNLGPLLKVKLLVGPTYKIPRSTQRSERSGMFGDHLSDVPSTMGSQSHGNLRVPPLCHVYPQEIRQGLIKGQWWLIIP